LERVGQTEIYLLDNDSAFPPLLRFYQETRHQVIYLAANSGPYALWNTGILGALNVTGRFILSDPDVVPTEDCPDDAIEVLSDALDRFPDRVKAGIGLRIDDLPDHYPKKSDVLNWESQFWQTELAPGLYDANIDTTFALYRPDLPFAHGPSIRTGPPYLARHVPWYTDPTHLSDEEKFYFQRAGPFSHWFLTLPQRGTQDEIPIEPRASQEAQQSDEHFSPYQRDDERATLRILDATYGSGKDVLDVTTIMQALVRNGRLNFYVSNVLFTDPCPNVVKTLRFTFQHLGDERLSTWEVPEHGLVLLTEVHRERSLDHMVALTIGMPTYNDFDGVYFTMQALRHYQDLEDTELLVVDNYGCEHTKAYVEGWAGARYILATDAVGTAAAKNRVFAEAKGEAVLCCDSHVMFLPGVIARLKAYYQEHPHTRDLLQGPLVADDLQTISTHFDPVWIDEIWGFWATDPRGLDPDGEPFDIPMQGMGAFSCRKEAWLGFNPAFRGFGGEEGYIHEKFRQAGARTLCLPWLRWVHRFGRPAGVPYPALLHDKVKNYIIGFTELGLDLEPVREHFSARLSEREFAALGNDALADAALPTPISLAAPNTVPGSAGISPAMVRVSAPGSETDEPTGTGRAIICFVEDNPHLIQQVLALRLSWLYSQSQDTDLVVFGPEKVLARLPDDLVKIAQRPASKDPVWGDYRYINALACLNGAGAEQLEHYSHILRTDVDTFITPAWNAFCPNTFTFGAGAHYADDDQVRQRLRDVATEYGLVHRGMTNIGSTWYGPTAVVRRAAGFAEMLTRHLLTHHFASDPGEWPGWYRGVAMKYAAEIAVNHCAPDARRSELLDVSSTSTESIEHYPHIHCWHTDKMFSKHTFMRGGYALDDADTLDMTVIRDYCLALSLQSLEQLALAG
jgi:hypothetical protein